MTATGANAGRKPSATASDCAAKTSGSVSRVEHLKRQLDDARRAGFRQAAPFAKPLKTDPQRPGRRAG